MRIKLQCTGGEYSHVMLLYVQTLCINTESTHVAPLCCCWQIIGVANLNSLNKMLSLTIIVCLLCLSLYEIITKYQYYDDAMTITHPPNNQL